MEKTETIIPFVQSETNTKTFRNDYPVSEELKEAMLTKVFKDFTRFALERYYPEYLPILTEYLHEHEIRGDKRESLLHNLFWWRIFYDSSMGFQSSCIEDFIVENYSWLSKRPILISWLKECGKAIPKFYFVGYKYNDRVLVVMDSLEEKPLNIIVYDPLAIPPIKGEIVMGTILPLGNGLFFPISDFYHFDYQAREEIAHHLHYYYDLHMKTSPINEAFIHVLSAMLQIEKLVFLENQ